MNMQTLSTPASLCKFVFALPIAELPIQANSRDYGFDFDEDELGKEFLAPLPFTLAEPPLPEMAANEFESRHLWFLS